MLNRDKHRILMFQIIKAIFSSAIGSRLALKGGTACYFLYGLDRFSTDLDFDIIDPKDKIDDHIYDILIKFGTPKKGSRIILSYGNNETNIKIDISRKIWKSNRYEEVVFFGTPIKIQTKDTIFANKLVALIERTANRDIYDVYFFFKNLFDINEDILIERTGKGLKEILQIIKEILIKLPVNYKILDGLGEVLDDDQKDWAKTHLISELINMIDFKISFTLGNADKLSK